MAEMKARGFKIDLGDVGACIFWGSILVLVALFAGEPDIQDALIHWISDGAITREVSDATDPGTG